MARKSVPAESEGGTPVTPPAEPVMSPFTTKSQDNEPAQIQSGGPLHPDPDAPPRAVHAPDLGDNAPKSLEPPSRGTQPVPESIVDQEEENAMEAIRMASKADILYHWNRLERAREDGARPTVVNAIRARLLQVQGPPLPPEVDPMPVPVEPAE